MGGQLFFYLIRKTPLVRVYKSEIQKRGEGRGCGRYLYLIQCGLLFKSWLQPLRSMILIELYVSKYGNPENQASMLSLGPLDLQSTKY